MTLLPTRPGEAERQIAAGLRTGWIALATLMGLMALSVALFVAFAHAMAVADDLSREDERVLVQRFVDRSMVAAIGAQMGLLNWNEAVARVDAVEAGQPDRGNWLDRQFGDYAASTYNAERAFLVRGDGALLRAWTMGKPVGKLGGKPAVAASAAASYAPLDRSVRTLIAQAMAGDHVIGGAAGWRAMRDGTRWPVNRHGVMLPRWAGGLWRHDGQVQVVLVGSIVPDGSEAVLAHRPAWFVTVQPVNTDVMARMRHELLLDNLRFSDSAATTAHDNQLAMPMIDGDAAGWIRWTAKSAGETILRRTAPALWAWVVLFLAVMAGGVVILRRTIRMARTLIASEAQARHNALHDAMTGLPNRVHTMQRLRQDLAACVSGAATGEMFVAYVDIDAFKVVNDTLGHHVGDELVREVAERLRQRLEPDDFIARFGGDEFVVLRRADGGRVSAERLGHGVVTALRESFAVSGNAIDVTCSCGISWGPTQSEDPGELLRRADIALYRAKQRGRARYRCFTRDMDASVKLRLELEIELRRAIGRDELAVAFQPIVDVADESIVGVEALLRWNHPERGPIRPDLFVPIAEQAGLMIPLGNWMLRKVFAECRDWPGCDISVNLSPIQIMANGFVDTIAAIVAEAGIDPRRVVLEITEGVMLDRSDHVLTVLRDLDRMGFRIALDDFGIGYSSLGYLRLFQFDRIKIDRSFVSNIEGDADANAILCSIALLGHSLRMKVVAEGVENETQRLLVQAAGCELIQGHLYWKAMPAAEVLALLVQPEARLLQSA